MREIAFRPVVTQEMKEAVIRALESGRYIRTDPDSDSEGKRFESELATFFRAPDGRVPKIANLSSGTAAMHLAWLVYGVGPGDEVIIPANTFSSVADCVWLVGADPVAVDVEEDTSNLDPDALEVAITPRTRAVMPVHTAGHPADMDRIMAIAERHDLLVIEDACQAVGARHLERAVGTIGAMGCYSFVQNKAMTTGGEGGAVGSFDTEKVQRVFDLANHARGKGFRRGGRGGVSVPKRSRGVSASPTPAGGRASRGGGRAGDAYRSVEHDGVGYLYRQSELLTAVGRVQLRLLPGWIEERRRWAEQYHERLADLDIEIGLPAERDYAYHAYVRFQIRAPRRDDLKRFLMERGVQTKVHYPTPIHLDRLYRERYGAREGQNPVTERLAQHTLSLPLYPQMSEDDVDYVVRAIREFYAKIPTPVSASV